MLYENVCVNETENIMFHTTVQLIIAVSLLLHYLLLSFLVDVIVCSCGFESICNLYRVKKNIKMHTQIELLNIMDMQQHTATENRTERARILIGSGVIHSKNL